MRAIQRNVIFVVISLVVSVTLTAYSLNYMEYRAAEEAAIAYFGFPFSMRETDSFYGGYGGQDVRKGGKDYVLSSYMCNGFKADWTCIALSKELKTDWKSIVINLLCYNLVSILSILGLAIVIKKARRSMHETPANTACT